MSDQEMNDEKFELGLSFHQQGNPDQAEMIYREVLNDNPNHKHAWSNHLDGKAYVGGGKKHGPKSENARTGDCR